MFLSSVRKENNEEENYMNPDRSRKALFNLVNYSSFALPRGVWKIFKPDFEKRLSEVERKSSSEYEYIMDRVNFYNRLSAPFVLPDSSVRLRNMHLGQYHSAYLLDFWNTSRWFDGKSRLSLDFRDVYWATDIPSVVKSRPIESSDNNVLLKLDRLRHFRFVEDSIRFEDKSSSAVFRADIGDPEKQNRVEFMEKYFGSEVCDCGSIRNMPGLPDRWIRPRMTIADQLKYKFIISLEGNDVATSLKWIMSSNSLAVTPLLKCETWYMESRLVPGEHFVLIRDDYSDLPDKMEYYSSHPKESQEIIENSHRYIDQFLDKDREDLIEYLVLKKYFGLSGQL